MTIEPIKIFYCYTPQDKDLRDELEKHLMTLKRLEQITLRLNREILAGTDWSHIQDERFQMADLILLLVSPDFIASDYHYHTEMRHALEKHEAENVWVIPIIIRPTSLWTSTPLGKLRALPNKGKAVTEWANLDAAFVDIVKGISEVVAALLVQKQVRNFSEHTNNAKITHILGHTCPSCGIRSLPETTSCENCGDLLVIDITMASQEETYSPNQRAMKTTTSFFPDEIRICRYCAKVNSSDEQFCAKCGGYIQTSAQSVTLSEKKTDRDNKASQHFLPNGSLQDGRYIVEKFLGQGGMGKTVLARDTRIANKLVAIKELISTSRDPQQQQEDARNFKREVETLAELEHPLIPNVTASFQEGSHYFMVQEYVVGENLENRIERLMRPLPEQDVLMYASQILDVLDYLEQQRPPIIHRDIKPANLIINSRNKRAYVVDFGIARADRSIVHADKSVSKQTSAIGTPGYAPPEQYDGNADPRSDLYALAATLHHLLTNRDPRRYPPFVYPSVRSLNPKLSLEIESMLNQALMADITKRYQNAAAMKHDIDDIRRLHFETSDISTLPPFPLKTLSTPDLTDKSPIPIKTPNFLICPNCSTNYPPEDQFCSKCGTYLYSSMKDKNVVRKINLSGVSNDGSITVTNSGGIGKSYTLTPGTQLEDGRYIIEKVLGMGSAALAKDILISNKQIVIKELISTSRDPQQQQQDARNFKREVEMLAHLDHPLIPTVTDSFNEGTHYFMVQEYVAGENLEAWMGRINKPIPERVALGYISQVLDILNYLEQQMPPINHRDIKPANIIVSNRNKHAYLVDFGISRPQINKNGQLNHNEALGTPGYAPPEQYKGDTDQRSDLYALAATLHHLLTKRDPRDYPPFVYPSVRTLNPQLSLEIERMLEQALKINVNERYQNAAAMKYDIDEILTQRFGVDDASIYTFVTFDVNKARNTKSDAYNKVHDTTFEKFTKEAIRALSFAQEEAVSFQHNYVGTEHLLLGLLHDRKCIAAKALANLNVESDKVRSAVEVVIARRTHGLHNKITESKQNDVEGVYKPLRHYTQLVYRFFGMIPRTNDDSSSKAVLDPLALGADLVAQPVGRESIIFDGVGPTPGTNKTIELAIDEARSMRHQHIGTEHLLLGLLREGEGIAASTLESLDINLERVRTELSRVDLTRF